MSRLFSIPVFKIFLGALAGVGLLVACTRAPLSESSEYQDASKVLLNWNKMLLEFDRYSEGYRPPVSARMYAYMGIMAWEVSLPDHPGNHSLANKYPELTVPSWDNQYNFILPVALHAGYEQLTHYFFPHRSLQVSAHFADLHNELEELLKDKYAPQDYLASRKFGEAIADAIYRWSATDTIGHQAFLFNYDHAYVPPKGPGLWSPSNADHMPPLLPHWGRARTFITDPESIASQPPLPFSETHGSPLFGQALEVYQLSQPMTEENRWIAEFWSDDFAGVTFCPASRWISITNQIVEQKQPGFATTLKVYLELGLALNDVTVKIWHDKYLYNRERPGAYIARNIYPNWQPLHNSPSFPSYPSGHAGFAGSASTILAAHFGDPISFTDASHKGRKEFIGKPRSFHSFTEMARENAFSRLPMGVHLRMDCAEGLRLGQVIGKKTLDFYQELPIDKTQVQ